MTKTMTMMILRVTTIKFLERIERLKTILQYERGLLEVTLAGDWSVFRPSVWQAVDQVGPKHKCDRCFHYDQ